MKKQLTFILVLIVQMLLTAYPRLSILERWTNAGCAPCASLNNAWYTNTTQNMVAAGLMTHIVYNVDWPSPSDPMFLLNSADNNTRRGVYAVNSVPWLAVNGTTIASNQAALESSVSSGNTINSPFKIVITPELFNNNVISVSVKVHREAGDVTTYNKTRLFVALSERTVSYTTPPGSNGETVFYSISRKMLPDGKGTLLPIPAPGDSVVMEYLFIPDDQFRTLVNLDSIRVVAFIQSMDSKFIHQSASEDLKRVSRVNSAMKADITLGAAPLTVQFTDFSSGTQSGVVNNWQWDFNNDGTIDANTQNPSYTYVNEGNYSVKLVVSNGHQSHTRIMSGYINAVSAHSDILVVNGIEFATYPSEMANFYNNSAGFGSHEVDVWDLFGEQDYNYSQNQRVKKAHFFNRSIPADVFKLYPRIIWFGNNYGGDYVFWNPQQVLDYVNQGGNFLLATRQGGDFLNSAFMQYCGISSITGLTDITSALIPMQDSLAAMPPLASNTRNQFVTLDAASPAIPLFDENASTGWIAAFRIKKDTAGSFIYIAGRPYRFDNAVSAQNYEYIINKWMNYSPATGIEENIPVPSSYSLEQNYPNPFNPSTTINYSVPYESKVTIKVTDMIGRELAVLADKQVAAGRHSVSFNAADLASGMYIYSIKATAVDGSGQTFTLSRKMILIK